MINRYVLGGLAVAGLLQPACAYDLRTRLDLEPLIVKHAAANGVPAALVHRIIIRESRYNPRAVGRGGAMGLMQIKHGTARALGYTGSPAGLLDADTNLTYAVRYLAGAYRVANGDQNRAVGFYARGYYYDAKRRGLLGALAGRPVVVEEPATVPASPPQPSQAPSFFSLFAPAPAAEPAPAQAAAEEPEAAAPAPARRGSAAKRAAPATALQSATGSVAGTEVPLPPRREGRAQRNAAAAAPAQAPAMPARASSGQAGGSPAAGPDTAAPLTRSARPAKRTGVSGADRSARTASEQPGDPGKSP